MPTYEFNHTAKLADVLRAAAPSGERWVNGAKAFFNVLANDPYAFKSAYESALTAAAPDESQWLAGWDLVSADIDADFPAPSGKFAPRSIKSYEYNHTEKLADALRTTALSGEQWIDGAKAFFAVLAKNPYDFKTAHKSAIDAVHSTVPYRTLGLVEPKPVADHPSPAPAVVGKVADKLKVGGKKVLVFLALAEDPNNKKKDAK